MITLSGDIWDRWKAKRTEIAKLKKYDLAGLFEGHEAEGFRNADRKVLYTGKATAGPFDIDNASDEYFDANRGAFWSFARRLSSLTGGDPKTLQNIAWSNICKIGTVKGNPNDELAELQRRLAVETLKLEWTELKPSLVVCVAEGYQEHFIYQTFDVTQNVDDGFLVSERDSRIYYRPPVGCWPAFLWLRHPQGKPTAYLEHAEEIAALLLR